MRVGVVETALLRTAGSAVTSAVKRWLGRRRDQRERETSLVELIGAGIADDVGLRRASRRLDDIKDTVYERLQPLIRRRDDELPDNEIAAALDAVTATLDAADLSDAALFADDVDPVLIAARLRRQLPDIPERAGLNDAAAQLYGRVLDECCVCLTQLVIQLGPFQARAAVQMLERLTTVADSLSEVLARLPVTSLDAPTGTKHHSEFRTRYLRHLLTTLDYLELFGVDVHRYRLRTPLSIAYISLAVSGATVRNPRGVSRWDPGLLRRDTADSASVRAEQALGNAERVLLRGDAGSGKTTLLRWIAVTAARQGFTGDLAAWNGRTPFLIRLRDHVKQALPAPERFLDVIAGPISGLMPPAWAHRQLGSKAILLVDGVDEVPKGQRREVRDWVAGLLSAYPDLRVVVTSRPAAASARWLNAEGFTPVFLERMGPADIRSLIRHWHEAVRHAGDLPCEPHRLPGYEQRLLAQLDGNAHLQNLAASPLLCAMLCALNLDRDSNLPRNRMDIYQAAVDMLLKRRDEKRGVHSTMPELTSRDQLQLLQQVAWWLTLNGRTELSRVEAEHQISQRLAGIRHITAAPTAVLEHMIERSGILREPVPDRIDFVHRTFQEYLAAREAADQGHTGVLLDHAHLDTWRETIILSVGHANVPIRNEILTGLLDRASQKPKHARRLRLLAAACLETAPAVEPQLLDVVRSHLRELVPRSINESRSLAGVGEPLLSELPADITTLTEAQAAATVRAAALVNGPAALNTLARYASDPRQQVQRELIKNWEYFDPIEYADKVLADAPLVNGHVDIRNAALLPALSRLRRLTRTSVDIRHRVDLAELADAPHLVELSLIDGFTGDLKHLVGRVALSFIQMGAEERRLDFGAFASLPNLTRLHLFDLAANQDLTPIIGLTELTELGLHRVPVAGEIFANLKALTGLQISPPSSWDAEDIFTPLSRLQWLALAGPTEPAGGVAELAGQLSRLSHFTELHLYSCQWVTDLEPLAKLASLQSIDIGDTSVTDLAPLVNLIQLQELYIGRTDHVLDLTPLSCLPELADLWVAPPAPRIDLTPLQGKRMTVHLSRQIELAETARPKGVRIKRF
jgi:hypothetical protein